MKTKPLYYLLIILLFTRCAEQPATHANVAESTAPDSSMIDRPAVYINENDRSYDWQGTYKGVLPCADCKGVEVSLTLNDNKTYVKRTKYLGKGARQTEQIGTYIWDNKGQSITLNDTSDRSNKYSIRDSALYQLDVNGNKMTGELAEKYRLGKSARSFALRDTYWKLEELNGRTLKPSGRKEIYIRLSADGIIQACGGCNNMAGGYLLQDDSRIRFLKLASFEMACPDLFAETEFLNMLDNTSNYIIISNMLFLTNVKRAPIARFEAMPGK